MKLELDNEEHQVSSIEELGPFFDRLDQISSFEVWLTVPKGPRLCMLRSDDLAFLMYLRHANGDPGFSSRAKDVHSGSISFTLANGQKDQIPRECCIDVDLGFRALAYFCVNDGLRTPEVIWHDDA